MRALLWLTMACGDATGTPTGTDGTTTDAPPASRDGATVYSDECSICHGDDGAGSVGPSLIDEIRTKTDDEIEDIVREGRSGMPPLDDEDITDEELADLIAYLRATFG